MDLYTVDRSGLLVPGQRIELDTNPDLSGVRYRHTEAERKQFLNELYPDGLSKHGNHYLGNYDLVRADNLGHPLAIVPIEPAIELVFELVRKVHFPDQPSRYQSFFAWDNLDRARAFQRFAMPNAPIYEVEAAGAIRKDMNLLRLGFSGLDGYLFAHRYWREEASDNPDWEYLLQFPVVVGNQVA